MRRAVGAVSADGWRYAIIALGGLYVAFAIGRALLQSAWGSPLGSVFVQFVLIGIPGSILVYGGYRLSDTDIDPDLYSRVAGWCAGGVGLMVGILLFYSLQPTGGITSPADSVPILTALAGVAGFAAGRHEARAKSRAREARQRNRDLKRRSRELERQNERLESFAEMLAHELRNPLDIAQIYHQQVEPRNEEAAREVDVALGRIEEMIDILLVTARGSRANIGYDTVEIGELATAVWSDVVANAESAELSIEADRTILANPVHVRHLFVNLFRNSIEHSDEPVSVRIGSVDTGFYVEDDGPGIDADISDDVVKAGFTTKQHGSGLGLTYAAQLSDTYGWEWALLTSDTGGVRLEFTGVDIPSTEAHMNCH